MLVGKREPSWTDRFSICQCVPSGRTTPWRSSAAIAQPPITWALKMRISRGFNGSAPMPSRACGQLV